MADLMQGIAPMLALAAANTTRNPQTRAMNMQTFQMGQQNARYDDKVARAETIRKDTLGLISEAFSSGADNPVDFAALAQKYPNGDPEIWASIMMKRYGTDSATSMKLLEMGQKLQVANQKDATTRRGQDITARGQDMTAQVAREGQEVTKRGQDITAGTAVRGQDITSADKGKDRVTNLLDLKRKVLTKEETPQGNQMWMQFSATKKINPEDRKALVQAIDSELAQLGVTGTKAAGGGSTYQPGQTWRDKTTGKLWRVQSLGVNGKPVWEEVPE